MATSSGGTGYPSLTIDTTTRYTLGVSYISCTVTMPADSAIPTSGSGNYMKLKVVCGSREEYIGSSQISYPPAPGTSTIRTTLPKTLAIGSPASRLGDATVYLECYVNGGLITAPRLGITFELEYADAMPELSLTTEWVKRSLTASGYYTNLDALKVKATVTMKYGATVKTSRLYGKELADKAPGVGQSIYTIDPITLTDSHTYSLSVRDSRGCTTSVQATASGTINSYTTLQYSTSAERCNSSGTPDPTGTKLKVILNCNKTGTNIKTTIRYRASTTSTWTTLTNAAAVSTTKTVYNYTGITLAANTVYYVETDVIDGIAPQQNSQINTVPQGYAYLYLNAKDKALGVGAVADANHVTISESLTLTHGQWNLAELRYMGTINSGAVNTYTDLSTDYIYLVITSGTSSSYTNGNSIWLADMNTNMIAKVAGGTDVGMSRASTTSLQVYTDQCAVWVHMLRMKKS